MRSASLEVVVASTIALARRSGHPTKMPEPTQFLPQAASSRRRRPGGDATRARREPATSPGRHVTDQLQRAWSSLGGGRQLGRTEGGKSLDAADDLAHVADGLDDVAGATSPFRRIIAAPSPIRRRASPRLVAPQTKGASNPAFVDVVGLVGRVGASDSSMKSIRKRLRDLGLDRNGRSGPWPSRESKPRPGSRPIIRGLDMRATPPSLRDVGRDPLKAMTAQAPRPRQFSPGRRRPRP